MHEGSRLRAIAPSSNQPAGQILMFDIVDFRNKCLNFKTTSDHACLRTIAPRITGYSYTKLSHGLHRRLQGSEFTHWQPSPTNSKAIYFASETHLNHPQYCNSSVSSSRRTSGVVCWYRG